MVKKFKHIPKRIQFNNLTPENFLHKEAGIQWQVRTENLVVSNGFIFFLPLWLTLVFV